VHLQETITILFPFLGLIQNESPQYWLQQSKKILCKKSRYSRMNSEFSPATGRAEGRGSLVVEGRKALQLVASRPIGPASLIPEESPVEKLQRYRI
jgi:hypothetical protein